MKNIKKVAYIFAFFAISSNLCFPDSPLDEQDGLVFDNNDQRSIFQSFKDADNDEKAAWALTGVSALGAIFAAIGYKFYDSTKKTKSLGNFIVIKSSGKDGKPVEKIIPVYEKVPDVPKEDEKVSDVPKEAKANFGDIIFVKGEVEPENKEKNGFKNGKFFVFAKSAKNTDGEEEKLGWVDLASINLHFGDLEVPVVDADAPVDGSDAGSADPAPAPVAEEEENPAPAADPVVPHVPVVVVDPVPTDRVAGAGADAEEEDGDAVSDSVSDADAEEADGDDSAADPVEGRLKRFAHFMTGGLFKKQCVSKVREQ